jgi:hypothetical protein
MDADLEQQLDAAIAGDAEVLATLSKWYVAHLDSPDAPAVWGVLEYCQRLGT